MVGSCADAVVAQIEVSGYGAEYNETSVTTAGERSKAGVRVSFAVEVVVDRSGSSRCLLGHDPHQVNHQSVVVAGI